MFYNNRYLNCIYKAILWKYFQNFMCDLKEKWKKNLTIWHCSFNHFLFIIPVKTGRWYLSDTLSIGLMKIAFCIFLLILISVKPIPVKPMLRKQYGLCLKIFVDSGKYYLLRYYGPSAFFKEYFCHWDVLGNSVLCHLRHLAPPLA